MKLNKKFNSALAILCLLFAVSAAAAVAQRRFAAMNAAQPEVGVSLAGVVERARGNVALEGAAIVNAGETLSWTITSENKGTAVARDYKTVGQIPKGTIFIPGSASSSNEAVVTYSIDNGATYSVRPMIEERQADGSIKQVPAPVSMYTQVQYEWTNGLAPNSKMTASYKVRVK